MITMMTCLMSEAFATTSPAALGVLSGVGCGTGVCGKAGEAVGAAGALEVPGAGVVAGAFEAPGPAVVGAPLGAPPAGTGPFAVVVPAPQAESASARANAGQRCKRRLTMGRVYGREIKNGLSRRHYRTPAISEAVC